MEVGLQAGTFSTSGRGYREWIGIAEKLDLKAMELWIDRDNLWPGSRKSERRAFIEDLNSHGIKVPSISPTPFKATGWREFKFEFNLADPNESMRARAVNFYRKIIELAAEFDSRNVLVVPGKINEPDLMKSKFSYRQHWDQVMKSLKECSKFAKDSGVFLGIENAVICNYVDLPEELKDIVEGVDSDNVKAYLDLANANVFRDPELYIRALAPILCTTIHATDNDGVYPYHLPIGMGTIDYRRMIRALKDVGWDGYLLPEIFYSQDPVGGLRRCRDELLRIIRSS